MFPDIAADFFLAFSHLPILLLIVVSGFLFISRALFFQTACLAAFDIMVNVALKGFFKVPLAPALGPGFAFPSGHMQLATVFYLWLALYIPLWPWRIAVALLLAGIGAGLIHYDYHSLQDVLAGLACGLLLLGFYRYALMKLTRVSPWLLIGLSAILMADIGLTYILIPTHAWSAFYTLSGLVIVERVLAANRERNLCWQTVNLKSATGVK
ncbi:phosphatase PAP2 family protein [Legionella spiritensis]|uniref:PAP2 superfamily protein n=1 Tax=Legionella spiritensis TaxID=452 RepID=A0A0W0Z5B5_LEGSP|nr:phosphatase PAP2 family protein [Legionella spiritensis]KTD64344.1 PAP2 superfamily protein [Legionella spiritensis]SNV46447.1 PAP2 superfamily [Legionella spiritensis]